MKISCRYVVIDLSTSQPLVVGEKAVLRDKFRCPTYVFQGTFRTGFLIRRDVFEFSRETSIKGRKCLIVYWLRRQKKPENYSVVTISGQILGLSGGFYERNKSFWQVFLRTCSRREW